MRDVYFAEDASTALSKVSARDVVAVDAAVRCLMEHQILGLAVRFRPENVRLGCCGGG